MDIFTWDKLFFCIGALIAWQYFGKFYKARWNQWIQVGVYVLGYVLLLTVTGRANFWENILWFFVLNFLICSVLYGEELRILGANCAVITVTMVIANGGVDYGLKMLFGDIFLYDTFTQLWLLHQALTKLTLFIILQIICHFYHMRMQKKNRDYIFFLLFVVPMISIFIMVTLFALCARGTMPEDYGWMVTVSGMIMLVASIFIFWVYDYSQAKNQDYVYLQGELQKEAMNAEYYKMLAQQNENQRILVHDIKNHLRTIEDLAKANESARVQDYIYQLTASETLKENVAYSSNPVLNVILNRYKHLCQDKGIPFNIHIRSNMPEVLNAKELSALTSNLFDNAMEACENAGSDKYIDVMMNYDKDSGYWSMVVENSCIVAPEQNKGGQYITNKKDAKHHGYGLRSVRRIVAGHKGYMDCQYEPENRRFVARTVIKYEERD